MDFRDGVAFVRHRREIRLPRDDPLWGCVMRGSVKKLAVAGERLMMSRTDHWVNPPDFAKRLLMKSFDSRTYSINDFVEWDKQGHLKLNPSFQRRPVWSDSAKSYLMDTILRGKPIPKVFIRQKINVTTKTSEREIVDGQQRLRTILSFVKDGFVVAKRQNSDYGGKFFSQLDESVQAQLLSYELAVDLLINMPDKEILDIFSRLNSYAVILNEQEKIHAEHFSAFKVLTEQIGHKYYEYWVKQKIFAERKILRMQEVNLVADLLIAMKEGIKSKKQVKKYYDDYELNYDENTKEVEDRFDKVIEKIAAIYPEGVSSTEFRRPFLFYSFFTAVAHCLFRLPGLGVEEISLATNSAVEHARNRLDRIEELFEAKDVTKLTEKEREFLQDSRRATTDEKVRIRRTKYLLTLIA